MTQAKNVDLRPESSFFDPYITFLLPVPDNLINDFCVALDDFYNLD